MAHLHGDLDPETADRLLTGRLLPDDAPPRYNEVTQLIRDAHMDDGPSDVADDAVVRAMVAAINSHDRGRSRSHVLTRFVTVKAAAATAVLALSATGAAAASGSLPDAAQDGIARAAARIGINLPDSASDKARIETQDEPGDGREETAPAAPEVPADDGETATPGNSVADEAPDNHGSVVSDTARNADPEGGKGDEVAPIARDNHGREVSDDHRQNDGVEDDPVDNGDLGNGNANPNAGGAESSTGDANSNAGAGGSNGDSHAGGNENPTAGAGSSNAGGNRNREP